MKRKRKRIKTIECRYVPRRDAEKYARRGYVIKELLGGHTKYSVLAVKR